MLLTMSSLLYRHSEKPNLPCDDGFLKWLRVLLLLLEMLNRTSLSEYPVPFSPCEDAALQVSCSSQEGFQSTVSLLKRQRKTRESKKL
jgi:hypothetical protein